VGEVVDMRRDVVAAVVAAARDGLVTLGLDGTISAPPGLWWYDVVPALASGAVEWRLVAPGSLRKRLVAL
jgi:hypothetical protein